MELIPILSLIILASTISTFILAVGAYVLYKIRERKGRVVKAKAPDTIQGEVVAPAASILTERKFSSTGARMESEELNAQDEFQRQPRFMSTGEYNSEQSQKPANAPPMTATYAENHYKKPKSHLSDSQESERYREFKKKLTMFTTEGDSYEEEKKRQEDGLKWR